MTITASGRTLFILAAGLWLGIAGPMRATETSAAPGEPSAQAEGAAAEPVAQTKPAKASHVKKAAVKSHKADKAAAAKAEAKNAQAEKDKADAAPIPEGVANANAQWPSEAAAETPQSVFAKADSVLKGIAGPSGNVTAPSADTQVVAADEVNELDRAVGDDKTAAQPPLTLASATLDAPAVASPSESSSLDKTSLIGKIFIAFGGLLTLASAARMFIA